MSAKNNNKINVPEARAAMDKFKMEAASEVGVCLPQKMQSNFTFEPPVTQCLPNQAADMICKALCTPGGDENAVDDSLRFLTSEPPIL